MENIVILNSLFITVTKLLLGLIKSAVNIVKLIKDIIAANSSPTIPNKNSLLEVTIV